MTSSNGALAGAAAEYTASEMMIIAGARLLRNGLRCFVGIGKPGIAANLARTTHAPDIVLVYESGTIGARPAGLPLSIGDGELAETAELVVSLPEVFNYWLQGGLIDVGFLGAAEIDRHGNLNTTVIGDYAHPAVRLPGAGGAPEITASAGEVVVIATHTSRTFVERVGFLTSAGPLEARRSGSKPSGRGVTTVITDLGVLRLDERAGELVLSSVHPGTEVADVQAATGWPLRCADATTVTDPPRRDELAALRALLAVSGEMTA